MGIQSAALARSPQPAAIASEDADTLQIMGAPRSFTRDQEVFGEGEAADFVYKVVSGAVRSFRVLADGRRQISDFYLPGDVFGVELGNDHGGNAEVVADTMLIVARRSSVAGSPDAGPRLWRLAARDLERSRDHVMTLGRRSACERVASLLIDLAERTGAAETLELPMSRQDMADYLGLTIETVSRTLTQLQNQGLVDAHGCRRIRFLDRDGLADLCQ
jgi:CRP/FNR family nitrogen fixation transcriptional regulator